MKKQILIFGLSLFTVSNIVALPTRLGKIDYKSSSVSNLDFNMSWENLEIKESRDDNTILVEVFCNKRKYTPKVSLSGSTLLIDSVPFKTLLFPMERKECTVIVHIPSGKKFDKANIILSSGNMQEIENISADIISLRISSGNINVDNIKADQAEVIASSGDIKVENVNASKFVVQASSGNIVVDSVKAQDYTAKTSSGNIKTNSLRANVANLSATSGRLNLKDAVVQDISFSTSSGGISADELLTNSFTASSSSGTIGLELRGTPSKKSSISSSSGTVFVSLPNDAAVTVSATTSSGSLINTFTKEKIGSHADYKKQINGGGAAINLSTTSGNITIDKGNGPSVDNKDDTPVVIVDRPIFE